MSAMSTTMTGFARNEPKMDPESPKKSPSVVKLTIIPETNNPLMSIARLRELVSFAPMTPSVIGIMGKTHGVAALKSPAKKTRMKLMPDPSESAVSM